MNLFQKKHDWILGGFEFLRVDNVTANAGTGGAVFATDDIGGIHYPRSKVVWGADGAVNDTSAAAPLPVVQTGTPALPTGASTAAKQPAIGTAGAASADVITVQGVASMTPLLVNGSAVTQPISDAGGSVTTDCPQLPSTLGQTTMAASMSVALASNQSSIPVTGTFFQATQPVSAASLPLPTGAAAETTLAAASAKLPAALGQTTMAASMSVALASNQSSIPVAATLTAETTKVIGTVNVAASQTIAATNAGTFAVQAGQAAHDAIISGNPVRVAGRGMSADYAAVASGDVADILASLLGKQVILTDALPANTWSYAAAAGGLVTTTGVTAKAAAGAGVRNYVSKAQIMNSHQTIGSEIMIRDGAVGTVLWRGWAQFTGGGAEVEFKPPLRGTANTLIEIAEVTATATAGVLVNLQGFVAAE